MDTVGSNVCKPVPKLNITNAITVYSIFTDAALF